MQHSVLTIMRIDMHALIKAVRERRNALALYYPHLWSFLRTKPMFEPMPGELWYIKHKGASSCLKVKILATSYQTVVIEYVHDAQIDQTYSFISTPARYPISDIQWIEKLS